MTTRAQLRKAALALPGTEQKTEAGSTGFLVHGVTFACAQADGVAWLRLGDYAEDALARLDVLSPAGEGAVQVELAAINGMHLNSLVEKAWLSCAPARLAEARLNSLQAKAPPGPDALPTAIGKPATRALLAAGIDSLTAVAGRSEQELLALHGVGPKAIRLLSEALAGRGSGFRRD